MRPESAVSLAESRRPNNSSQGSDSQKVDPVTVQSLHQQASAQLARLSLREYRVLQRVVAGDSNKIIASRLGISRKTVEKHRGKMMRKLDVRTVPGLMIVWLRACPHELYSQAPDDGVCGG